MHRELRHIGARLLSVGCTSDTHCTTHCLNVNWCVGVASVWYQKVGGKRFSWENPCILFLLFFILSLCFNPGAKQTYHPQPAHTHGHQYLSLWLQPRPLNAPDHALFLECASRNSAVYYLVLRTALPCHLAVPPSTPITTTLHRSALSLTCRFRETHTQRSKQTRTHILYGFIQRLASFFLRTSTGQLYCLGPVNMTHKVMNMVTPVR